jgi:hypothetical protein
MGVLQGDGHLFSHLVEISLLSARTARKSNRRDSRRCFLEPRVCHKNQTGRCLKTYVRVPHISEMSISKNAA